MNDDLTLLASAYLDGEATPDERARVEADELLLSEVDRMRIARAALLDSSGFEHPDDNVREAAITAALTAWDSAAIDGTAADAPQYERTSSVVPFVRRFTSTRWLTAAAVVVGVAGLGLVIAQLGGSDGDDSSVAVEAPAATTARADGDAALTEQLAPPAATDALLSNDVAADDAGGADPDASATAEVPTAAAATGTDSPADTEAAADSTEALEANLESLDELAAFAVDAKQAVDSQNRDAPIPPCGGELPDGIVFVATGTYRGRQVVIGIDDERATAIDADSCEIVAEASLP